MDIIKHNAQISLTKNNDLKYRWSIHEYHYYAGDDATEHKVIAHGEADSVQGAYEAAYMTAISLKLDNL